MNKMLWICSAIFLLLPTMVKAQCCAAGNPLSGDATASGLPKNNLRISTSFRHSYSDKFFFEDQFYQQNFVENSRYNFTSLQTIYGISDKWAAGAEMGYFIDKSQASLVPYPNTLSANGLGDLLLFSRYRIMKKVKPIEDLSVMAGVKIPIGAFDVSDDGVRLPVSLQPSSGAMKFQLSLSFMHQKSGSKFSYFTQAFGEISSAINSDFFQYHYGPLAYLTFSPGYRFLGKWQFNIPLRAEWRGKDKRDDDLLIDNSGSVAIYAGLQCRRNVAKNWSFRAAFEKSLYKYVNGYQLTNAYSFNVGVLYNINLAAIKKN